MDLQKITSTGTAVAVIGGGTFMGGNYAVEMGHAEHLMGMKPHQTKFLGHSVGLELDESPVIANGFACWICN